MTAREAEGNRKVARVAMLVFLVGACSGNGERRTPEELEVGQDVRLEGRVLEVDATPMFVDGDGEVTLRTEPYGTVLVRIPAGERLCQARGLDAFHSVAAGDSLRALGLVTAPGEVTVCAEKEHHLQKLEPGAH